MARRCFGPGLRSVGEVWLSPVFRDRTESERFLVSVRREPEMLRVTFCGRDGDCEEEREGELRIDMVGSASRWNALPDPATKESL